MTIFGIAAGAWIVARAHLAIYLQASVPTLMERIGKRGRGLESGITAESVTSLIGILTICGRTLTCLKFGRATTWNGGSISGPDVCPVCAVFVSRFSALARVTVTVTPTCSIWDSNLLSPDFAGGSAVR